MKSKQGENKAISKVIVILRSKTRYTCDINSCFIEDDGNVILL